MYRETEFLESPSLYTFRKSSSLSLSLSPSSLISLQIVEKRDLSRRLSPCYAAQYTELTGTLRVYLGTIDLRQEELTASSSPRARGAPRIFRRQFILPSYTLSTVAPDAPPRAEMHRLQVALQLLRYLLPTIPEIFHVARRA